MSHYVDDLYLSMLAIFACLMGRVSRFIQFPSKQMRFRDSGASHHTNVILTLFLPVRVSVGVAIKHEVEFV